MKIALIGTSLFLICKLCCGQYYFNDIILLQQTNKMFAVLKYNKINTVTAESMQADNTPTQGFSYKRVIKNDTHLFVTNTSLEATGNTTTLEYYDNSRLVKSDDTTLNVATDVTYSYNSDGAISTIETQTSDTSRNTHSTEIHKWFYTDNIADSMLRIKDGTDTTFVYFKKDDKQNLGEEIWMKRKQIIEHYYYYYDEKNRLTDIVRFNYRAQQMLPDFLFTYYDNGTVSQLTQIPQGSSDYVIWQYLYNDKGLKDKDVLFDKHQQLLGTITYNYQ